MPSQFEPCGLTQLISFRYGTVPIVRETGGLKDTVRPFNEYENLGDGFSLQIIMHMKCYMWLIMQNMFTTIENVYGTRLLIEEWQMIFLGILRNSVMKDCIISYLATTTKCRSFDLHFF